MPMEASKRWSFGHGAGFLAYGSVGDGPGGISYTVRCWVAVADGNAAREGDMSRMAGPRGMAMCSEARSLGCVRGSILRAADSTCSIALGQCISASATAHWFRSWTYHKLLLSAVRPEESSWGSSLAGV